jgi:16S rRNA (uracil1498-N3)-methyltransferase
MQQFYLPSLSNSDSKAIFSKEESKHLFKVLRKRTGDLVHITNGKGSLFSGKIETISSNVCEISIDAITEYSPAPYQLHMAVAPTKMNDRFEWFLEKATEIGVTEITPILCDHSERKTIKIDRYKKILISAMKQSLRTTLPLLHPLTPLGDFLTKNSQKNGFIAHCHEISKEPLAKLIQPSENVVLLIGPEGDFSLREIQMAKKHNFKTVSLGDMRLRTETAAIVGCHTVALANS